VGRTERTADAWCKWLEEYLIAECSVCERPVLQANAVEQLPPGKNNCRWVCNDCIRKYGGEDEIRWSVGSSAVTMNVEYGPLPEEWRAEVKALAVEAVREALGIAEEASE
jgi:hypothetical protein